MSRAGPPNIVKAAVCLLGVGLGLVATASAKAPEWPNLLEPPTSAAAGPPAFHRFGVVIGVETYTHLPPVRYATHDAQACEAFFEGPLRIPSQNIARVYGERSAGQVEDFEAAIASIVEKLKRRRSAAADSSTSRQRGRKRQATQAASQVWVCYAGHGAAGPDGARLLLGAAAQKSLSSFQRQGLSVDDLLNPLAGAGAEVVALIDTCYSGVSRDGKVLIKGRFGIPENLVAKAAGPRVITWFAADAGQIARPLDEVEQGAFTYLALGALRGWADGILGGGRDHNVSLKEAVAYVERAFQELQLNDQTPIYKGGRADQVLLTGIQEAGPRLKALPRRQGSELDDILTWLRSQQRKKNQTHKDHEEKVAIVRERRQKKASPQWKEARALAWQGGTAGELAVRAFVESFRGPVSVDGEPIRVQVPELKEAEGWLACLEGQAGAGPFAGPSGYAMRCIPGGSFTMGSPKNEEGRDADEAQHQVTLSPFLMGELEVTQGLYEEVMKVNPSRAGTRYFAGKEQGSCAEWGVGVRLPVFCIDWYDALRFANALSERDGLRPVYRIEGDEVRWLEGANGYRLPTETEWERAARGRLGLMYGETADREEVCDFGNVATKATKEKYEWLTWDVFDCEDQHVGLAPVGQYRANGLGLYDLVGNVWEWTWDYYGTYGVTGEKDPRGLDAGSLRVYRGGSWGFTPPNARVSNRVRWSPGGRDVILGFRLSRSYP